MLEIVVCDDDIADLECAVNMLHKIFTSQKIAYHIEKFMSANQMLENISRIDIGILDISMEELNGIKLGRKLKEKFPDVKALAEAPVEEIEEIVRPCGLGKSKAKDISACMKMLKEQYGGKVPDDFDALLKLPGVGRKSANLIMGDVFGKPAIVTDTHCIRLVNRMGLVKDIKEPKKVEMELWKIIPPEEGNDFCHRLVEHGRDVCTARTNPHCDRCVLNDICATGKKLMKAEQKTK